jgi:hypothetical protein
MALQRNHAVRSIVGRSQRPSCGNIGKPLPAAAGVHVAARRFEDHIDLWRATGKEQLRYVSGRSSSWEEA